MIFLRSALFMLAMVITTPLIVLALWMGLYPQPFLDFFEASVANLVARHEAALSATRLAGM